MALTQAPRGCAVNGSEEEKEARRERPGLRSLGGQGERARREGKQGGVPSTGSFAEPSLQVPHHTHITLSLGCSPPQAEEAERGPNGSSLVPLK